MIKKKFRIRRLNAGSTAENMEIRHTDFNQDTTNKSASIWPAAKYGCENWTQKELDGKYSERVQLPAKAKFGGFVANTWQHLPHLLSEV